MFNIGFSEFLAIGIIALLVIGPKQLPEVAKVVGRLISELKKATQDLSGGLLQVSREVKSSIEDTKVELEQHSRHFVEDLKGDFEDDKTEEVAHLPQDGDDKIDGQS